MVPPGLFFPLRSVRDNIRPVLHAVCRSGPCAQHGTCGLSGCEARDIQCTEHKVLDVGPEQTIT